MRTLLIAISLLASTAAYSQNVPQITVSSEKVKVNGNIMYVHKVKGGETLYSLAKGSIEPPPTNGSKYLLKVGKCSAS